MKYLKTFEDFDMGKYSNEDDNKPADLNGEEQEWINRSEDDETKDEFEVEEIEGDDDSDDIHNPDVDEEDNRPRPYIRKTFGDEVIERKKYNFEKKKGDKKEDKKEDKKSDKKDDKKETKGLSAGQKKLPPALQKAILARKKK